MSKAFPDFVDVQLSAAGLAAIGKDGSLHIATGRLAYRFAAGSATRVLSSEWARVLSRETVNGEALLEIAPTPAPKTKVAAAPAAPAAEAPAQESSSSSTAKGSN